ncbi:nucleolar protein NOP58-like protein [Metarhizium album ARSEF 1941]|uniref:Nucleolar protein 58 n=1 Tax=Metarhizium album (strain ARSEF 1941) TaxID=1081103 RepID=A0A0B2X008_METAS|nr:nucleolar protein NOP58-like protein [Metarhizium album ARSEF 1941]KHN99169.1 nucleolar protein NOP58-like protein [Metarhizium album ARSEF 1941]
MSLFVLAETPAGYGLFKASDKKIFKNGDLAAELGRPEKLVEMLKLKKFVKFDSAAMALEEAASLKEGKVPALLTTLLEDLKSEKKASLAVADMKLGTAISNLPQFNITPVAGSETMDCFRGIREHLSSLIPGLEQEIVDRMSLGLSHSMSRHRLKFSVDKVDSMIIQAVKLIDDMDKELNVYAMRTKEWYGWHFPEMAKILNDNMAYARVILAVGMRTNIADADLSEILPEEVEVAIKAAAEISMGTEITEEDVDNIKLLAEQVIRYSDYRTQLSSYLETRMRAIAPNLTALVGYLVGARLIAHAGSLISLAKAPSSTIQILGAEKALFRALKTKHDTPKYGLIYHSSLIGQATGRNKGKIARMLAAKAALGLRVDALGGDDDEQDEEERAILGLSNRIKLENHLRRLEGKPALPKGTKVAPSGEAVSSAFILNKSRRYNTDADGVTEEVNGKASSKKEKKSKDKKPKIDVVEEDSDDEMKDAEDGKSDNQNTTPVKKVVKLSTEEYERLAEAAGLSVKKFKRKYERGDVELGADGTPKVFSKKEMKKLRKAEGGAKSTPAKSTPAKSTIEPSPEKKKKKRKYDDDDEEVESAKKDKKQKKKKRHSDAE